jgi:hypothetical protein
MAAMPSQFSSWLSIADLTLHIVSDDHRLTPPWPGAIRSFLAAGNETHAAVEILAGWTAGLVEPAGTVLFESGGAWRLVRAGQDLVFTCRSSLGSPEPYTMVRFDSSFARGEVSLNRRHFHDDPAAPVYPLEYPLDELVMIHLLSQGRGVEIHGCGILDGTGRSYIFAGQSGAGKSTIARLWAGRPDVTVLSDERVVVRTDEDRITLHGTPWHGDAMLVSPRGGMLAGVFFLRHAAAHAAAVARRPQAAAKLLSCSFLPFYDAQAVARTIDAVDRIVSVTPCFDLAFAPDRSILDFVTTLVG